MIVITYAIPLFCRFVYLRFIAVTSFETSSYKVVWDEKRRKRRVNFEILMMRLHFSVKFYIKHILIAWNLFCIVIPSLWKQMMWYVKKDDTSVTNYTLYRSHQPKIIQYTSGFNEALSIFYIWPLLSWANQNVFADMIHQSDVWELRHSKVEWCYE